MVRRHVHNTVPKQKRPIRGEDQSFAADNMFSGVHGRQHVRSRVALYRTQIRRAQQITRLQTNLLSLYVRHRYGKHQIRFQQCYRRHNQKQSQRLWPTLNLIIYIYIYDKYPTLTSQSYKKIAFLLFIL